MAQVVHASPDAYMVSRSFLGLLGRETELVAHLWYQYWDAQAPKRPGALEIVRMYDALEPFGQCAPGVVHQLSQSGPVAGCQGAGIGR